ncbi:MAG: hypothetical protein WB992_03585 [Bryobacteraceae bacterium]
MHKRPWLAIALSIATLAPVNEAPAQWVVSDPPLQVTTLIMHAQQVMQYIKEAQTALQAIQMAQMMAREGIMLAKHPSTNIMADLNMLSTILVQSQGLAGSMAQMDVMFRNTYAPFSPSPVVNWASAYNNWASTTLKTLNGSLNAAGYQGGMLQNEQMWMQQVQAMNQLPLGRDASLQLGNSIATEEVAQLQSLRQLMIADMQSKAAYTAQAVNTQQAQQTAAQSGMTYSVPTADARSW